MATMDMLNNEKNSNGIYVVAKEIQYEIVFKVSLVQKTYKKSLIFYVF